MFGEVDWASVFSFEKPILETFARGTTVYLMLFVVMRVVLKRQTGAIGITDLLVTVLLADAAQNAMAGDYKTVPDGILLILTIVFWCYLLDYLSFRFPAFARVLEPAPLPLVKDGKVLHRNLRKELVTMEELESHIREEGIDDISKVKEAHMESDGKISVVENK